MAESGGVIRVKGSDGTVKEVTLYTEISDVTDVYKEFKYNGATVYACTTTDPNDELATEFRYLDTDGVTRYLCMIACKAAKIDTISFPTGTWGTAWSGYVTFTGSSPLTLTVTSVPSWVSYTIGEDRIDFSGTPGGAGVTGTNTISFSYANCGSGATTVNYTFVVNAYNTSALYSSDGTFTVPDGVNWLMVTLVSGAPGSWTTFPLWSTQPSWLKSGCTATSSDSDYTYISDASGGASSFGNVFGTAVIPLICMGTFDSFSFGSATYYSLFGTSGNGVFYWGISAMTSSYYWSDDSPTQPCYSPFTWTFNDGVYTITLKPFSTTGNTQTSSSGAYTKIGDSFGNQVGVSNTSGAVQTETSQQSLTISSTSASVSYGNDAAFGFACMPLCISGWFKVSPGEKYSYTVGAAGKACYLGASISSSTSSISSSGTSKANAGGGAGKVLIEWGSSFEDSAHDNYNTPTALSTLSADAVPVQITPVKKEGVTEFMSEVYGCTISITKNDEEPFDGI